MRSKLNIYLNDNNRRLFEIDDNTWIKRVFSEKGILFECVHEPEMLTTKNKFKVIKWFIFNNKLKNFIKRKSNVN